MSASISTGMSMVVNMKLFFLTRSKYSRSMIIAIFDMLKLSTLNF